MRLTDSGVAYRGKVPALRRTSFTTGDSGLNGISTRTLILAGAGLAVLLALVGLWVLMGRRRKLATGPSGFRPGTRDFLRVQGDRMRVVLDERGAEVVILVLGLAAAIALGALVAG